MRYTKILLTGVAGFIGFHLAKTLLDNYEDTVIVGIDNINSYYSSLLKEKRLAILKKYGKRFSFIKLDFSKWNELESTFKDSDLDLIIHLGAQAGVRYSLKNPWEYERSNILGTLNIFELARQNDIDKVIYASSSSVYGGNTKIPFSEVDRVDNPISIYAATKRSNELFAYTYHNLYGIKMIGLRFFTVYGEWGRPDMAYWKFAKNILLGKPITLYNYGNMKRDFTYISDIISGVISAITKDFDYEIFNLGNSKPIDLKYFVSLLERYLGKAVTIKYSPAQPGDPLVTYADISKSKRLLGYTPRVPIEEGLKRFCIWFLRNREWVLKI